MFHVSPPAPSWTLSFPLTCLVSLTCCSCAAQAEQIMEAIELYREETAKLKEHKAICKAAGKEVKDWGMCQSQGGWVCILPAQVESLSMHIKSWQVEIAETCRSFLENKMALHAGGVSFPMIFVFEVSVGFKFCPWESMLLQVHPKAYSLPSSQCSLIKKRLWYRWEKWQLRRGRKFTHLS